MVNVVCKRITFVVGVLLCSIVVAAVQPILNKQSILFQVNQDSMSFDHATLKSASIVSIDPTTDECALRLKLKKDATTKLKAITSHNLGQQARFTLNGTLISSPIIQSELGAEFVVTGLTREQAQIFIESIRK